MEVRAASPRPVVDMPVWLPRPWVGTLPVRETWAGALFPMRLLDLPLPRPLPELYDEELLKLLELEEPEMSERREEELNEDLEEELERLGDELERLKEELERLEELEKLELEPRLLEKLPPPRLPLLWLLLLPPLRPPPPRWA